MADMKMQLVDWLDDLTVRFLLNLPPAELSSVPRLCFQVEEAQWYYEDFIRPAAAAAGTPLPSLHLRQFCLLLFQHCPLLSGFTDAQHIAAYDEFLAYKTRVPVRGAIMMDETMEKVVLVKGWKKSASWSFPRGKINKDEKDLDCAIREVDEETGFDIKAAGLVPASEADAKFIDVEMKGQQLRMFVFRNVPTNTNFAPKTRKEISKIAWYNVRDLPGFKKSKNRADIEGSANKFYMVAPFLPQLKKWIGQQRRQDSLSAQAQTETEEETDAYVDDQPSEPVATDRSDELRKLLSIGGASSSSAQSPTSAPRPAQQGNSLLALLQGTSSKSTVPQTPLEQVHIAPQHPESPKPHHPRQPSMGAYQQPPPQFPLAHSGAIPMQQQQLLNNGSMPTYPISGSTGSAQQQDATTAPIFQASQQVPIGLPALSQAQWQHQQAHQPQQQWQQSASQGNNALRSQVHDEETMGAVASAPKASQLPPPTLNQHSMRLLDAFRGNSQPAVTAQTPTSNAAKHPSAQQAALLGLFRQPSQPTPAQQDGPTPISNEPTSPQPSSVAKKPDVGMQRRPTLNEITRTLPMGMAKRKSSSSSHTTAIQMSQQSLPSTETVAAKSPPQAKTASPTPQNTAPSQIQILQRNASSQEGRPSQPRTRKPGPPRVAPSSVPASKPTQNGVQSVPVKILQRPGAAQDAKSPTTATNFQHPISSSAKRESPKLQQNFQPQLLKRDKAAENSEHTPVAAQQAPGMGVDKTTQLLALFNKSPQNTMASQPAISATESANLLPPASEQRSGQGPQAQGIDLKNQFDTTWRPTASTNAEAPVQKMFAPPAPPSAPRLSPATKPVRQETPESKQQHLLNLFMHKPQQSSLGALSTSTSPGTPISPFALPTPAQANSLASFLHKGNVNGMDATGPRGSGTATPTPMSATVATPTATTEARMSRSPSIASPVVQTPTEHKDFLLGYLNGVVQKEGYRGGKRP